MQHKTGLIDQIEETVIAALLGLMTLITFANVVARYVFNSNILWALELTVFMFGWLVLLGASYAVKKHAHLGVDAILNMVSPPARRVPLRRYGIPEEVANMTLSLVLPAASFLTGVHIPVDGGMNIKNA